MEAGIFPRMEFLAVFSKPTTYPGFADPPKLRTGTSSTWRHRSKDFESNKETSSLIESVQRVAADPTGLTGPMDRSDRSGRGSRVFKSPLLQVVVFESLESFSVYSFSFLVLKVRAKVSNAKEG